MFCNVFQNIKLRQDEGLTFCPKPNRLNIVSNEILFGRIWNNRNASLVYSFHDGPALFKFSVFRPVTEGKIAMPDKTALDTTPVTTPMEPAWKSKKKAQISAQSAIFIKAPHLEVMADSDKKLDVAVLMRGLSASPVLQQASTLRIGAVITEDASKRCLYFTSKMFPNANSKVAIKGQTSLHTNHLVKVSGKYFDRSMNIHGWVQLLQNPRVGAKATFSPVTNFFVGGETNFDLTTSTLSLDKVIASFFHETGRYSIFTNKIFDAGKELGAAVAVPVTPDAILAAEAIWKGMEIFVAPQVTVAAACALDERCSVLARVNTEGVMGVGYAAELTPYMSLTLSAEATLDTLRTGGLPKVGMNFRVV